MAGTPLGAPDQNESPGEQEPRSSGSAGTRRDPSRGELSEAGQYWELIVDTVRESLLVLDLDLRVKSASESFYRTFGVPPEETIGRPVYELGNGQWDIPELRRLLESILPENKTFDDYEVASDFEGIGHRVMLLNARQVDHRGLILLAIDDVTERRRGERQLRESQDRFRLLVENALEYAILLMDRDARITMWNPGAVQIFGWRAEEAIGEMGAIIFTEEHRIAGEPEEEIARAIATGSSRDDRWHRRKDGSRFWATGFMVALHSNGELRGFAKILRDDTERKQSEEEREKLVAELDAERRGLKRLTETLEERVAERTREVRNLASTLTMAEQQERRRISQILHDDLQQILYGIQLKLAHVRRDARESDVHRADQAIAQIEEWLRNAIDTTRRLTVELSPPLLEGEGLRDALDWLARQMEDLHGLQVELRAEHNFRMEDKDLRVLLFQIVRELLFNVVKHADTRRARVELEQLDGHFAIHVVDEGVGFDPDELNRHLFDKRAGGFGLLNARERLALFGGRMEIDSRPERGTRIAVIAPVVLEARSGGTSASRPMGSDEGVRSPADEEQGGEAKPDSGEGKTSRSNPGMENAE